jgi:hypothetical protein
VRARTVRGSVWFAHARLTPTAERQDSLHLWIAEIERRQISQQVIAAHAQRRGRETATHLRRQRGKGYPEKHQAMWKTTINEKMGRARTKLRAVNPGAPNLDRSRCHTS